MSPSTASGDPIADRRFAIAAALAGDGDLAAATDVLGQALELAPTWAAGWLRLGEWRERMGDAAGAASAYARARTLDSGDVLGAGLRLAALAGATPGTMPAADVAALFDDYAPRFDAALTGKLAYRTPALLADLLGRIAGDRRFSVALDLGCGTGLMGEVLRARVDHLAGVDLAPRMVAAAARKAVYARLATGDALAFLDAEPAASADLVVAADMLPYVGDAVPLLAAAARVLAPGGFLAVSAERADGAATLLGPALRYRHPPAVLAEAAARAGLAVRATEPAVLRTEAGRPVEGFLLVAELPGPG